jgi:RecJ-like exonuclease
MPRKCPDCKAEMPDDGVHAWCDHCDFDGYVVVRTGKILREDTGWQPGIECEHGYDACPMCDGSGRVDH